MNLRSFSNSSIYSIPRRNLCPPVQREAFKKENLTIKQIRNTSYNTQRNALSPAHKMGEMINEMGSESA